MIIDFLKIGYIEELIANHILALPEIWYETNINSTD